MSLGANVVSGVHMVPDLEFCKALDPSGQYFPIYNRYSFAYYTPTRHRDSVVVSEWGFPDYIVKIHPLHPALRARNVRYFLFLHPLPDPTAEGLELLKALPQNEIWIYGFAGENAAGT
jgi:hypothetical protein